MHSHIFGFSLKYSISFALRLEHFLWIRQLHDKHGIAALDKPTFFVQIWQLLLNSTVTFLVVLERSLRSWLGCLSGVNELKVNFVNLLTAILLKGNKFSLHLKQYQGHSERFGIKAVLLSPAQWRWYSFSQLSHWIFVSFFSVKISHLLHRSCSSHWKQAHEKDLTFWKTSNCSADKSVHDRWNQLLQYEHSIAWTSSSGNPWLQTEQRQGLLLPDRQFGILGVGKGGT